jgi:hypothetical protein
LVGQSYIYKKAHILLSLQGILNWVSLPKQKEKNTAETEFSTICPSISGGEWTADNNSAIVTNLRRDAKGVEVIQPGEQEKIKEVSDQFNRFQMMNFNEHHHCLRGTHLKTQGVSYTLHLWVVR